MSKDNNSAAATKSDSATKKHPTGDYEVGYCRPPVHTQYEKGKSGNPKGRTRRGQYRCGRHQHVPIRSAANKAFTNRRPL
jgi:hypothetical protein